VCENDSGKHRENLWSFIYIHLVVQVAFAACALPSAGDGDNL